jgi:hypothetical protein
MSHGFTGLDFGHGNHGGVVTRDAIIIGHSFGVVAATPHIDAHVDGHACGALPEGTMEGNGPSFDVPADSGKTNFGILVVGLGICDWESKARAVLVKLGLAECFNLQPPNPLFLQPQRFDTILPANFGHPAKAVANPVTPRGFYKGAAGSTTFWRTNWQVGDRSAISAALGRPATRRDKCRTYLEVEVTVWHYLQAGDYEIRIVVRTVGGKDPAELAEHVNAARVFCKEMLKTLQATPPSSDARRWREQYVASV